MGRYSKMAQLFSLSQSLPQSQTSVIVIDRLQLLLKFGDLYFSKKVLHNAKL